MDDDHSKQLGYEEFRKGVHDTGLELGEEECRSILDCDWLIVTILRSDWLIVTILSSDWLIVTILSSDWLIVTKLSSDWLICYNTAQ